MQTLWYGFEIEGINGAMNIFSARRVKAAEGRLERSGERKWETRDECRELRLYRLVNSRKNMFHYLQVN